MLGLPMGAALVPHGRTTTHAQDTARANSFLGNGFHISSLMVVLILLLTHFFFATADPPPNECALTGPPIVDFSPEDSYKLARKILWY